MMRYLRLGSAALLVFALAACEGPALSDLEVVNENEPDRERVLASAGDVESLVSSGFFIWHSAHLNYYGPILALSATADETSCSWGNAALRDMSSEPRREWNNSPSYTYGYATADGWYKNYEALSAVYDGLKVIEEDPAICDEIDCPRIETFAKFIQGLAHGYLALQFDSAFVFDETVDLVAVAQGTEELPLVPYPNVMTAALGYLDQAITDAENASWTLPTGWIRGNAFTGPDLAKIANALYVRFLTQVNRTPADRDAINWNTVIARVDDGLEPGMGGIGGPDGDVYLDGDASGNWAHDMLYYGAQSTNSTWQRADYKTIGFTDQSGGYQTWLATTPADRQEFVMNAADARIHPAGDGLGRGLDFQYQGPSSFPASRGSYHWSMYMHHRYEDYAIGDQSEPFPFITYEAQQLMKAEGLDRTGQAGAAEIVNRTWRDRGGMTAATDADANLRDKIIYEYLIENFIVCTGCAFYNRRGWGPLSPTTQHHWGLVEGTPRHFPVPGEELEILEKLNYSYGGVGNEGGSLTPSGAAVAASTRVPARMIYAFNGLESVQEKLDFIYSENGNTKSSGVRSLIRH